MNKIASSLQLLDVQTLHRPERDYVETTIYRKPTFTGLYTRCDSYSSRRYKINLIKAVVVRAEYLCSSELLVSEMQQLKAILRKNGYPKHILDGYMGRDRISEKPYRPPLCPVYMPLPWVGTNSDRSERSINEAARTLCESACRSHRYSSLQSQEGPTAHPAYVQHNYTNLNAGNAGGGVWVGRNNT